jgi:hypothetical protein
LNANDPLAESATPTLPAGPVGPAPRSYKLRCWRCGRVLGVIEIEAGREIPPGVAVSRWCENCKAKNRIPLDKLIATGYDRGNGITE